ncbi:MAG TPA: NifU family protein [Alphaproteobacteria bacterium]|nr:NifU family protein [Alphaproteobacteria bacterium]
MFIQTEETPNPATMKFLPGREVMVQGTLEITDAKGAEASPLAESLFKVEGVKGVFLAREFITVTKAADKEWQTLKPSILSTIMDHFTQNRPVLKEGTEAPVAAAPTDDSEVVKQIREILDIKVRPAVAQDGGDITFQSFEDGILYLNLKGSCAGCPSSTATLKAGIENMMKHYIPEVKEVRQIR